MHGANVDRSRTMTRAAKKKDVAYGWGGHICDKKSSDCNARKKGDVVTIHEYWERDKTRTGIVLGHSDSDQWVVLVGTMKFVCQKVEYKGTQELGAVYEWKPEHQGPWEIVEPHIKAHIQAGMDIAEDERKANNKRSLWSLFKGWIGKWL